MSNLHHKSVSNEYISTFHVNDYYSNTACSERVTIIDDKENALLSKLWMIKQAEKRIILSTYDFKADESGKQILSALCKAAEKGVKIEIVTDGINGFFNVERNRYFQALGSYETVTIYLYNKVNFLNISKLQYCLHDKYLIIDNSMYMLGGRNINDLFLGNYSEQQFMDRDLIIFNTADSEENSLHSLAAYFYDVISLEECTKYQCNINTHRIEPTLQELRDIYKSIIIEAFHDMPNWEGISISCNKITLLTNPIEAENKEPIIWYALNQLMLKGNDIIILTPYIICSNEMYEDLNILCNKTNSVKMVINDVNDTGNPWGCIDFFSQQKKVKATGLDIYQYARNDSLHIKTILIDNNISIVGSYNFDMRSAYLDTELMLVIDSKELNQELTHATQKTISYCKYDLKDGKIAYGENYNAKGMSWIKKIFYACLGILIKPIRHLL